MNEFEFNARMLDDELRSEAENEQKEEAGSMTDVLQQLDELVRDAHELTVKYGTNSKTDEGRNQ